MLNPFVIRKYATLLMSGLLPTIFFYIGVQFYSFFWGLGLLFVGLMLTTLLGVVLLKNPFTLMLEGKGILVMKLDSTGIIKPYLFGVRSPWVFGKVDGKESIDVFDRDSVFQLAAPRPSKEFIDLEKKKKIEITLDERQYNEAKFAMFHWPVLIWNDQIKSLITKDFLDEKEKNAFAEHQIIYLNRRLEELSMHVRDFGRAVVELLKPMKGMAQAWWFWVIVAVIIFVVLLLFAPQILKFVSDFASVSKEAVQPALEGTAGAVTPQ